jgi:hypothetical protein
MKTKLSLLVITLISLWINQGCITASQSYDAAMSSDGKADFLSLSGGKALLILSGDIVIGTSLSRRMNDESPNFGRDLLTSVGFIIFDFMICDLLIPQSKFSPHGGPSPTTQRINETDLFIMNKVKFVSKPDFIRHYELINLPNTTKEVIPTAVSKP